MAQMSRGRTNDQEQAQWRQHSTEDDDTIVGETEPLLYRRRTSIASISSTSTTTPACPEQQTWTRRNFRIYILLFIMLVCINTASNMLGPAKTRIFESIYCREWYANHPASKTLMGGDIDEQQCKIAPIQRQLSVLAGWIEWWNALPGLFLAIPFGILADHVGRKWVLRGTIVAIFLREVWTIFVALVGIDLRAVYLSSVLNLMGGGDMVAEMVFCIVLTDITPSQKLPIVFFQLTAFAQLTKVIGPAMSGGLMKLNPWYVIVFGMGLQLITAVLVFMVPETLKKASDKDLDLDPEPTRKVTFAARAKRTWSMYLLSLRGMAAIWSDWRLIVLAGTYPLRMMTLALDVMLQRYVSLRYGWTLADAAFLYSLQACVAAALLLIVLPWISTMMESKFHYSAINKNVTIATVSLGLLALGFIGESFAPTIYLLIVGLTIQTLGSGGPPALRALAGVLVRQEDNGRVFSGLAISESLSVMAAYPISAALFNAGIGMGGGKWLGLPYFANGAAVAIAAVILSFLKFEKGPEVLGAENALPVVG